MDNNNNSGNQPSSRPAVPVIPPGTINPAMLGTPASGQPTMNVPPGMMQPPPPPPPNLPPQYHEQWRLQMQQAQQQQQQQFMRMQQQQRPGAPLGFNPATAYKFLPQGNPMTSGQQRPPLPPFGPRPPPQQQQQLSRTALLGLVPPYRDEMDEAEFVNSLSLFLQCFNFNLQKPFLLAGRPISLKRLFGTIKAFGGFGKVSEARKWPAVGASLGFPPPSGSTATVGTSHHELLTSLHSFCATFLLPYEQFMIHKIPAESITSTFYYIIICNRF